jgi:hypothetical protein
LLFEITTHDLNYTSFGIEIYASTEPDPKCFH